MREKDQFKRDLPSPPRRSQDNYTSAIAELYRALDEAEMVAPTDEQRAWVDSIRQDVREHLMNELDKLGEQE